MGNSEVGHLNLGAGRVVMQDLVRISSAIAAIPEEEIEVEVEGRTMLIRGERKALSGPVPRAYHQMEITHGLFQRETRLGRFTNALHTPFDAFELASDAVARGNLKVFEEIGLQFARYLETGHPAGLRPGDVAFDGTYHEAWLLLAMTRLLEVSRVWRP